MILQLAEYIGPRTVAPGKANIAPRGFSLQARGRPRDKLHRPRNSSGKPRGYNTDPGGYPGNGTPRAMLAYTYMVNANASRGPGGYLHIRQKPKHYEKPKKTKPFSSEQCKCSLP